MPKEIGSDFAVPDDIVKPEKVRELPSDRIYLASGRDCLEYIILNERLKAGDTILVPAYLCESVLTQFKQHGIRTVFYKVNSDLSANLEDIGAKIAGAKAIIVIHYFGFIQPSVSEIKSFCNAKGVLLIEDMVHAHLTSYEPVGDYCFNSYRKIFPVPDGAYLISRKTLRVKFYDNPEHVKFAQTRLKAAELRNIDKVKSREAFEKCEKFLIDTYPKPCLMSDTSRKILEKIDERDAIIKRRANFLFLLSNVSSKSMKPLYDELPTRVCPLTFPILAEERDDAKQMLIENGIYPPVHWKLPAEVSEHAFPVSHKISRTILSIPIDHRYDVSDMGRIVKLLNSM